MQTLRQVHDSPADPGELQSRRRCVAQELTGNTLWCSAQELRQYHTIRRPHGERQPVAIAGSHGETDADTAVPEAGRVPVRDPGHHGTAGDPDVADEAPTTATQPPLKWLDAAEFVLHEEGAPMHVKDLQQRIIDRGLMNSNCRTSLETLLYRCAAPVLYACAALIAMPPARRAPAKRTRGASAFAACPVAWAGLPCRPWRILTTPRTRIISSTRRARSLAYPSACIWRGLVRCRRRWLLRMLTPCTQHAAKPRPVRAGVRPGTAPLSAHAACTAHAGV